jgi:adenine-specific DNA methylase
VNDAKYIGLDVHPFRLARQIKIGEVEQIDLKRSIELLELLQIPFLSVPKCRPDAECHETERRKQENHDPFADGSLPILGGRLGRAVTHGAGLTEGRRDPQQKGKGENSGA